MKGKKNWTRMTAMVLTVLLLAAMLGGCGQVRRVEESSETKETAGEPATGTEAQADGTMTAYRADGSAVTLTDGGDGTWKSEDGAVYYPGEDGVLRARGFEDLYTDPSAASARQDGERFDAVIMLEGMEETVHYEHVRNVTLGFEMDYDYESFERLSAADSERFVSVWDDAANPENYLEVTKRSESAEDVAAAISEELSVKYDLRREDAFELERAGRCIRIDASADVGGKTMPDQLQMVYIIPAPDGCRVATAHYAIEASEGFGRRFQYMMHTFAVIAG
ncbi:MAG: fimbrillin family protein [Oscillospiraceae bacterium]|nr:fimbrillin family protein [Oscillospiraceae bacterium]